MRRNRPVPWFRLSRCQPRSSTSRRMAPPMVCSLRPTVLIRAASDRLTLPIPTELGSNEAAITPALAGAGAGQHRVFQRED
ncbi:MAG: hypothetical protein PVH80_10855 [Anaerolineae bacterium]|jgi:hypothetical protein